MGLETSVLLYSCLILNLTVGSDCLGRALPWAPGRRFLRDEAPIASGRWRGALLPDWGKAWRVFKTAFEAGGGEYYRTASTATAACVAREEWRRGFEGALLLEGLMLFGGEATPLYHVHDSVDDEVRWRSSSCP